MNKNKEKRSKKKSLKKRSIIFSISTLLILCVIGTCVGYYIYVRNKIYTKNENIQFQTIEYENKKRMMMKLIIKKLMELQMYY